METAVSDMNCFTNCLRPEDRLTTIPSISQRTLFWLCEIWADKHLWDPSSYQHADKITFSLPDNVLNRKNGKTIDQCANYILTVNVIFSYSVGVGRMKNQWELRGKKYPTYMHHQCRMYKFQLTGSLLLPSTNNSSISSTAVYGIGANGILLVTSTGLALYWKTLKLNGHPVTVLFKVRLCAEEAKYRIVSLFSTILIKPKSVAYETIWSYKFNEDNI